MVPFPAPPTLLAESWAFSWSSLVWLLCAAIETWFFFCFVHCNFIYLSVGVWFSTFVACWSALSRPLAYLSAYASVNWSCSSFLLTLLDFPLSIMANSISVSNQPAFCFKLWDERIPHFILYLFDAAKFVYDVQPVMRFLEFVSYCINGSVQVCSRVAKSFKYVQSSFAYQI